MARKNHVIVLIDYTRRGPEYHVVDPLNPFFVGVTHNIRRADHIARMMLARQRRR